MGEELKKEFGADIKLQSSFGGVFEVSVAEKLVFSKKSLGRFPEDGEIVGLVKASQR